jgi:hypothetical protein
MQSTIKKIMRQASTWAWLAALAMTAGAVSMSATRTDEANAKSAVKKMSDYMAAQKAISFDYDTNLEVVTKENQKLGLASSGSMKLNRPDKIRATREGGFANVEYVYDGKTLTMLGKNVNAYAQVDWTGNLDQLVDELRSPGLQNKGRGLGDLDCSGEPPVPLPLRRHQHRCEQSAAVLHRYQGVENGGAGCARWLHTQDSRGCQEAESGRAPRLRRTAVNLCDKERLWSELTWSNALRPSSWPRQSAPCASRSASGSCLRVHTAS